MSHETPVPESDGLGAALRDARERAGLDLSEISARTHVRKAYLEALEAEDLGSLPEDVYARNFLRLYARTVDMDVDDALARYDTLRQRSRGRLGSGLRTDPGTAKAVRSVADDRTEPQREATVPPQQRLTVPTSGRPLSAALRGMFPLLATLVLAGALVGTAVWGFNRLLFRPDAVVSTTPDPEQTSDLAGTGDAAPASGLAAPALPGGEELPAEVLLSVDSEPAGAEVTVDAFPLPGTTPITNVPVSARELRTLRVEREGYLPYEATIDLREDRQVSVVLEPIPSPDAGPAAGAATGEVVVEVREPTWLEAYQSTARGEGERLVYTTAQPGERFTFARPVYLHLGNAGGVDVTVDGEPIGPLGSGGAVTGQAFPAP